MQKKVTFCRISRVDANSGLDRYEYPQNFIPSPHQTNTTVPNTSSQTYTMQQYIGAFLVAACLLEPQVVQSKEIYSLDRIGALAPTIDQLVDSTRFANRRSLQADSVFAEFGGVDDDATLNFLAGIEADLDRPLASPSRPTRPFVDAAGFA